MNINDEVRRLRDQIADINRRLMAVRRAVGTHDLLSSVHPDTTPASAVRGDLITGQGVIPLWKRLALGAAGKYPRSDGVDVLWANIQVGDLPAHASSHEVGGGDLVDVEKLTNFIDWTNAAANFKTTVASGYAGIFMGGRVGIGTTAPGTLFNIKAGANIHSDLRIDSTTADYHSAVEFYKAGVGKWAVGINRNTLNDTFDIYDLANTKPILTILPNTGNVGIGTISPATSAKLEISSTTGALLLSRMTTTQRDALTAVNGMLIYNTTTTRLEAYENGAWVDI